MKKTDTLWRAGTILAIGCALLIAFFAFDRWWEEFRGGDPWGYYAHLPAFIIHHDAGDYQQTIVATQHVWPDASPETLTTPTGRRSDKYPIGVALFLSPFFLIGHGYALMTGQPAEGFTRPYALSCGLGVLFYVLWGLYVLFGVLRRYFSLRVTVLLTVALALATNLFYFAAYNNMMAHALLFTLYCFLLYALHRFEEQPDSLRRAAAVGLCVGLITVTRLHEAIVVLVPLLWGVYSWPTLRARATFLLAHWKGLAVAAVVAAIAVFPQALYYKFVSGQWWYYAYIGENFDFRHPKIWAGLTSYSNGWLIYTPLMIFALLGLFLLRRFAAPAWLSTLVFLSLHIYITYSWWCWNYINGLGSRPMVETYALLAFPLGAFFSWAETKRWKQGLQIGLVAFFAWLNVFQTFQLQRGILWSENANKAYYWAIFGRWNASRSSLIGYESGEPQPRQFLLPVRTLAGNAMEDSTEEHRDTSLHHSGRYSVRGKDAEFCGVVVVEPAREVRAGDWLRIGVWAFQRPGENIGRREDMAWLVVEIRDKQGGSLKHASMHISSKLGNEDHSIWSTGGVDQWGEADFFVQVPPGFTPDDWIKAYVWNPARQKIYVDDLSLELWRDGR